MEAHATTPYEPARLDLGVIRCRVFSDGPITTSAAFLFRNAPVAERDRLLRARGLDPGALLAGLNCLLIETSGKRILLDTGSGGRWREGLGQLARRLGEAGCDPASIDLVVISHGHPDHIGGLVDAAGALVYPRARYAMSGREWAHWIDERALAAMDASWADAARATLPAIASAVDRVDDGDEVARGVTVVGCPGHTPGHIGLELRSHHESVLCVGDAIGHPLHVERPDWLGGSDADPAATTESRERLMRRAHESRSLIFANHFVHPALGRLRASGQGFHWQPRAGLRSSGVG